MTTKLESPVTRETCLKQQGRPINVTLSPATPTDVERCVGPMPERIVFHLKGTQQYAWMSVEQAFLAARNCMIRGGVQEARAADVLEQVQTTLLVKSGVKAELGDKRASKLYFEQADIIRRALKLLKKVGA